MYAAYIDGCGPPEEIRLGRLPVPVPGPTDVLVRVHAVSVNHVDTFVRSGAYPTTLPFPFVIGRDVVGTVAALGPGVAGFAVGDPVWCNSLGHAGRQGGAAQYAVVAADRLYRLPAEADPVTMVAVAHPAATAYLALHVHARLQAGETVLIGGAAGHVGRAAVVMARGARIVATAAAADLHAVRELGADVTLDYRDPQPAARLHEAAPDGLDVHMDTSGHHDLDLALGLLAPRGRVVLLAGLGTRPELPVGALYTRDAQLVGFAISNATTAELAAAAHRINQLVGTGSLAPRAVEHLPLSAAPEAHRLLETGGAKGVRLILHPPDEIRS